MGTPPKLRNSDILVNLTEVSAALSHNEKAEVLEGGAFSPPISLLLPGVGPTGSSGLPLLQLGLAVKPAVQPPTAQTPPASLRSEDNTRASHVECCLPLKSEG